MKKSWSHVIRIQYHQISVQKSNEKISRECNSQGSQPSSGTKNVKAQNLDTPADGQHNQFPLSLEWGGHSVRQNKTNIKHIQGLFEIIETMAKLPECMGLGYQNVLRMIISLLWILHAAYLDCTCEDFDSTVTVVTLGSFTRSTSSNTKSI